MDLELGGRKVLITGASQGIGAALARAFAAEGCDLHLTARSEDKLAQLTAELIANHSVAVTSTAIDLSLAGAAERVAEEAGAIDILVNNAGAIPAGSLFQIGAAQWRESWALKGFGYPDMIRAVYPGLKARGGGVILNNIGNGGEVCDPNYIEGAAANASLMAFTRALGSRSLEDKIRVVGVNPGPVDTTRIRTMLRRRAETTFGDASRADELMTQFPLGRPAKLHEITDLFLFLASFRSGYTSGTVFTVDGGLAAR